MRAQALLAKVAVVSAQPPIPTVPRHFSAQSPAGGSSVDSTPTATPPEEGGHFSFSGKNLPESPGGTYISFPMFEAFGEQEEDEGDDENYR